MKIFRQSPSVRADIKIETNIAGKDRGSYSSCNKDSNPVGILSISNISQINMARAIIVVYTVPAVVCSADHSTRTGSCVVCFELCKGAKIDSEHSRCLRVRLRTRSGYRLCRCSAKPIILGVQLNRQTGTSHRVEPRANSNPRKLMAHCSPQAPSMGQSLRRQPLNGRQWAVIYHVLISKDSDRLRV